MTKKIDRTDLLIEILHDLATGLEFPEKLNTQLKIIKLDELCEDYED